MTLPLHHHHSPAHTDEAARLIARLRSGARTDGALVGPARLTRAQILQQAASSVLTQANGDVRAMLALLR